MSHFSTLRSKLVDAEILKASLQDLGMTVKTHSFVRGLCGQTRPAEIVVVLEGDCDLGWSRSADGTLAVIGDVWGIAKKHNLTTLMNQINQKYAVKQTLEQVQRPGLQNASIRVLQQA